jgi:hypothetical protein
MTTQRSSARKITITREMLEKAARCNKTSNELYVAIQTHMQIEIQQQIDIRINAQAKGDLQWQPA